jgi:hypothetical protein
MVLMSRVDGRALGYAATVIRQDLEEHLTTLIMVNICTRDARLMPRTNRGLGVRLGPGDDEVTVFVSRLSAERLLANIEDNGQIALTAGDVATFKVRQLKGTVTRIADATEAQIAEFAEQREKTGALLGQFFGPAGRETFERSGTAPVMAITFRLAGVFEQTPRPGTGGRLA